jgi:hypothetical protein
MEYRARKGTPHYAPHLGTLLNNVILDFNVVMGMDGPPLSSRYLRGSVIVIVIFFSNSFILTQRVHRLCPPPEASIIPRGV